MKVRTIVAAAALAMLGFASCTNENSPENGGLNPAKGEAAYANFSITVNGKGTRATDQGLAEEQAISHVEVYVFAGGILEAHQLTEVTNNKTAPVQISTGEKVVYVIAAPEADSETLSLKKGDANWTVTDNVTKLVDFEKDVFDALKENIAQSEHFVMVGRQDYTIVKCTKAQCEAGTNNVNVDIDRAAAKVLVRYGEGVEVHESLNAKVSEAEFAICQPAKQMVLTEYGALQPKGVFTPGGATKANKGTDTNGTLSGYVGMPKTFDDGFFKPTVTDWESAPTNVDGFDYCAESRNENPVTGNTTFALVRVKVTPDIIYSKAAKNSDGKIELTKASANSNGDFWTVCKLDASTGSLVHASGVDYKILYFTTEAAAKSYITAQGLASTKPNDWKAYKFDKGQAYYRVNLVTEPDSEILSDKFRVERNNYYQIDVTAIKALGAKNGDDVVPTDPDTPVDSEANILTVITVKDWTVIEMGDTVLQ